jgi:hypothetical protein
MPSADWRAAQPPVRGRTIDIGAHSARRFRFRAWGAAFSILVALCGAWATLYANRALPAEEIAKFDGACSIQGGWFSGKIHNGSESWTIRDVTIRITLVQDSKGEVPLPPGFDRPAEDQQDYRIKELLIAPLENQAVHIPVAVAEGMKLGNWEIVAAKGHRNYW